MVPFGKGELDTGVPITGAAVAQPPRFAKGASGGQYRIVGDGRVGYELGVKAAVDRRTHLLGQGVGGYRSQSGRSC
jgi:hypothetical protein